MFCMHFPLTLSHKMHQDFNEFWTEGFFGPGDVLYMGYIDISY